MISRRFFTLHLRSFSRQWMTHLAAVLRSCAPLHFLPTLQRCSFARQSYHVMQRHGTLSGDLQDAFLLAPSLDLPAMPLPSFAASNAATTLQRVMRGKRKRAAVFRLRTQLPPPPLPRPLFRTHLAPAADTVRTANAMEGLFASEERGRTAICGVQTAGKRRVNCFFALVFPRCNCNSACSV